MGIVMVEEDEQYYVVVDVTLKGISVWMIWNSHRTGGEEEILTDARESETFQKPCWLVRHAPLQNWVHKEVEQKSLIMEAKDHVREVEMMPYRKLDVLTLSVLFDVIGLSFVGMFVLRGDKILAKFPFGANFQPRVAVGGRDFLLVCSCLYAYFSGRFCDVQKSDKSVFVDCLDCSFKAFSSISKVPKVPKDMEFRHSPDCMRRYCVARGDMIPKAHDRYVRRALMMVFAVRFTSLEFDGGNHKKLVSQLKRKFDDNLGWFMAVDVDDTKKVLDLLERLNKQNGLDLYSDFFKCLVLLHHHKVMDMPAEMAPFVCFECDRVTRNDEHLFKGHKLLDLEVNGLVSNPCSKRCVEMCNLCFMRKHMLPLGCTSTGTGYYDPVCNCCHEMFKSNEVAEAVVGKRLIDSVPYKDIDGHLLYVEGGGEENHLLSIYKSTKVLFQSRPDLSFAGAAENVENKGNKNVGKSDGTDEEDDMDLQSIGLDSFSSDGKEKGEWDDESMEPLPL